MEKVPSGAHCEIAGWDRERSLLFGCDNGQGFELRRWRLDRDGNGRVERLGKLQTDIYPLGVSRNGAFLFATFHPSVDTYYVDLDPASGRVTSQPRRINSGNIGKSSYPLWFDGGRMISYTGSPTTQIVTKRFTGGEERTFSLPLQFGAGTLWTADGALIAAGSQPGSGEGVFRVTLETGKIEPLLLHSYGPRGFRGCYGCIPDFSADGNSMYYRDDPRHAVVARNLKDSSERVLYQEPPSVTIRSVHLSPDEKWVAFVANGKQSNVLAIVPETGGSARELCSARWPDPIVPALSFAWMPDSKRILFVLRKGETSELWTVSIENPKPERAGLTQVGIKTLAVHPHGDKLAYAAGERELSIHSFNVR